MSMFKIICYVLFMRLCGVYGMEEQTITLQLQYPDGTYKEQVWKKADFQKITLFQNATEDLNNEFADFPYPVEQNKSYLTHEYFKNLITGNFVDHGLTQYVQNYNYFIGNDIMLPDNQTYQPFPSSLKWKVFKDNEYFFQTGLEYGPQSLQQALKTFLSYGLISSKKDYSDAFKIDELDLSLGDKKHFKLSLASPALIDFEMFELIDENQRKTITWLDLNNTFLFDLQLTKLLEYFPRLNKVSVKNTFVSNISQNDINTLKKIRDKSLSSNIAQDDFWSSLDVEGMMDMYAIDALNHSSNPPNEKKLNQIKKYASQTNWYSFILDLRDCQTKNILFGDLKNIESDKIYKKTIRIKGIKIDQRSQFQTLLLKLLYLKKYISAYMILSISNLFFIKILYVRNPSTFSRALIVLYTVITLGLKYLIADDLYRKFSCINSAGVIFD